MYTQVNIADYAYDLPQDRIAKYPLSERDGSRLLHYDQGRIRDRAFRELPELLERGTLMVFNNTRVVQARLQFTKKTGSAIEVFCLVPFEPAEYNLAFQRRSSTVWKCLVGNSRKWKGGALQMDLDTGQGKLGLRAERTGRHKDVSLIRFSWEPGEIPFGDVLEKAGKTPIPPYLNREAETGDRNSYQTVYSQIHGSVAAPTAGLHFTEALLRELLARGIPRVSLTLHVGAGTFRPVVTRELREHPMHAEYFSLGRDTLKSLYNHRGSILAVGTTSTRVLESIYWIGTRIPEDPTVPLFLDQWEAYSLSRCERARSLGNLLNYLDRTGMDSLEGSTRLMIMPGYEFQMVNRLLTNYHQPRSTLLLLVAGFIGSDWRRVYAHALDSGYRFLSYGDSSLLVPRR